MRQRHGPEVAPGEADHVGGAGLLHRGFGVGDLSDRTQVKAARCGFGGNGRPPARLAALAHRPVDRHCDALSDWDLVASLTLQPGQCVELRGVDGALQRSNCAGIDATSISAPQWFLAAYRSLLNGALSAIRPISYRGAPHGTVVAEQDAVATAGKAWATIAPLLGFSALFVAVLCLVAYFVIDRALRPAKEILGGLNRLARGDLACRLPGVPLGRAQPHQRGLQCTLRGSEQSNVRSRRASAAACRHAGAGAASHRPRAA